MSKAKGRRTATGLSLAETDASSGFLLDLAMHCGSFTLHFPSLSPRWLCDGERPHFVPTSGSSVLNRVLCESEWTGGHWPLTTRTHPSCFTFRVRHTSLLFCSFCCGAEAPRLGTVAPHLCAAQAGQLQVARRCVSSGGGRRRICGVDALLPVLRCVCLLCSAAWLSFEAVAVVVGTASYCLMPPPLSSGCDRLLFCVRRAGSRNHLSSESNPISTAKSSESNAMPSQALLRRAACHALWHAPRQWVLPPAAKLLRRFCFRGSFLFSSVLCSAFVFLVSAAFMWSVRMLQSRTLVYSVYFWRVQRHPKCCAFSETLVDGS